MKKVISLLPHLKKAEKWVANGGQVHALLTEAKAKAARQQGRIQEFWTNLKRLTQLVQAWARGEYRELPWKSLMSAIAALLYFVNPFDLLPDVLLFGYVDDALVVGLVLSSLKSDIEAFDRWLESTKEAVHLSPPS